MADRDPKDMKPAAARQLTTEMDEFAEIVNAVAAKLCEHVPGTPLMWAGHPSWHPICNLVQMMRRAARKDLPGLRTLGSPEMRRYVEALRTMAELAPDLHKRLGAELAEATPHLRRTRIECDIADSMSKTLDYLAGASDCSREALKICESVVQRTDPRRHWYFWGRHIGPMVVKGLRGDAERRGEPAPAVALTYPESVAVRLSVDLLAIGGVTVSPDAFAKLHKTIAKTQGKSPG